MQVSAEGERYVAPFLLAACYALADVEFFVDARSSSAFGALDSCLFHCTIKDGPRG
jgi:hypothetical protein